MKRKAFTLGTAFLALSLLVVPVSAMAATYVNDADVTVVNTALTTVDNYTKALNDSSVPISTVVTDGTAAQDSLRAVATHTFVTSLGSNYEEIAGSLKTDASDVATQIENIDTALAANDNTKADSYISSFNSALDKFNSDESSLNSSVDTQNATVIRKEKTATTGYLALFIATLLLTIGSFAWALRNRGTNSSLDTARLKVAKASIFPLIGGAITYGTFLSATKTGGTYFIAYGPMLIGGAAFARALAAYKQHSAQSRGVVSPIPASNNPLPGRAVATPVSPVAPIPPQVIPPATPVPPTQPPTGPRPQV
jgi:hypothetical protein